MLYNNPANTTDLVLSEKDILCCIYCKDFFGATELSEHDCLNNLEGTKLEGATKAVFKSKIVLLEKGKVLC